MSIFKPQKNGGVTAEKVGEVFEYGRLTNQIGKFGAMWKDEPYQIGKPPQTLPPHICWISLHPPQTCLAVLDNNRLEYHYSDDGAVDIRTCPVTEQKAHIEYIDKQFDDLYEKLELPDSLVRIPQEQARVREKKQAAKSSSKMKLIRNYLKNDDENYFRDVLSDMDDIVMWVDWREDDDAIVRYCEYTIQTGDLDAEVNDTDDAIGFEILISYKGKKHKVPYQNEVADRDTTIITLNEVLAPDYEIRTCEDSRGSDGLAFLPLSAKQWSKLENEFGNERINACFAKIRHDVKMFGGAA
jgi:hypothetical protein